MQRIYGRDGRAVVVEVTAGPRAGENRLRIRWPDGRELLETFSSEQALRRRLETLESQLVALDWYSGADGAPTRGGETDLQPGDTSERRAGPGDRRRVTRQDRRIRSS